MERILFLDGTPSMEPLALKIGASVKDQIAIRSALEIGAVAMYNEAIQIAVGQQGQRLSRPLCAVAEG